MAWPSRAGPQSLALRFLTSSGRSSLMPRQLPAGASRSTLSPRLATLTWTASGPVSRSRTPKPSTRCSSWTDPRVGAQPAAVCTGRISTPLPRLCSSAPWSLRHVQIRHSASWWCWWQSSPCTGTSCWPRQSCPLGLPSRTAFSASAIPSRFRVCERRMASPRSSWPLLPATSAGLTPRPGLPRLAPGCPGAFARRRWAPCGSAKDLQDRIQLHEALLARGSTVV